MPYDDVLGGPLSVGFSHRVRFCRGTLSRRADAPAPIAEEIARIVHGDAGFRGRVLPIVDGGFAAANPTFVEALLDAIAEGEGVMPEVARPHLVPGGEHAKNDPTVLDGIVAALDAARICRRSIVVAVGGGAVLDVVGFAAATFHRGVRLVRMPTTTLAQDDAAMGVKNGVNRRGKKNLLGAFAVPSSVLCDLDLLRSLSDRDWRSGFAEAVKIAVIRDRSLFDRIERDAEAIRDRDEAAAEPVIRRSAELHLRHILEGGDPFELGTARPLDFGHWAAHRLEAMSGHRLLHGEAVSIGVALDSTIAMRQGRLDEASCARIVATLARLGLPVAAAELVEIDRLVQGLEEFREHLGGRATIALPTGIGASEDVPPPGRDEVALGIAGLGM
jgi:3-dehydroquinate synthase